MALLLVVASKLLGDGTGLLLDGFAAAMVTWYAVRNVRGWRTFYRQLDDACTSPDETTGELLLSLRHAPKSRSDYSLWTVRILQAALRGHELGRSDRALRWLGALDPKSLGDVERIVYLQARAVLAVALGQLDVARETMLQLPQTIALPRHRNSIAILRALIVAIEGSDVSDERLASTRAAREAATGNSLDGWSVVEAHLLAARGDTLGALELLRGVKARVPPHAFERVVRHGGPASSLASRMQVEGAYR
ncbi:hypothetical protein AKJ09_01551 [Labilithrix luteola]|uniref:Uncharacterized protein n=1 Tax=Labilithrix luteola TaxID=1391654 RepID=A0A0K1PMZ5_9BACT|nr:hypothetical protein AKJ09_01551 [Labilithrix luteola]